VSRLYYHDYDAKVARLYKAGRTTREIGVEVGISAKAVASALRRKNVPLRQGGPRGWRGPTDSEARRAEIIRLYTADGSVKGIAEKLRCRTSTVTDTLRDAGISRRPFGHANSSFTEDEAKKFAAEYQAGATLAELGRKYGVSHVTIGACLKRLGVPARGPQTPRFWTAERAAEAVVRYAQGESTLQIASAMGTSRAGVAYTLNRQGVSMRRPAPRREKAHGWRGGRIKHGKYIAVWPTEDDLKLVRPMANGYVMEHRLVMARHLGRPLLKSETVHHIDGVRDHNDIDNLQLRQGSHGQGVKRVCLDCGSHNIGHDEL
jgi:lambda repressor-like predicted transcriptional regulator